VLFKETKKMPIKMMSSQESFLCDHF